MTKFTLEFDCVDEAQKRRLCDVLHKKYGVGAATEDAPAISAWLDDCLPQMDILELEVEILREYGNKDCTAMADERLAELKDELNVSERTDLDKSI